MLVFLVAAGLVVHAPADITAPCVAIMTHFDGVTLSQYGVYLNADEIGLIPCEYIGGDLMIEFRDDSRPDINLTIGGCHDEDADGDDGTDGDIEMFLSLYADGMPEADWNGDEVVDLDDVAAFFASMGS